MLCDKITILKEGRAVISCHVNGLLRFIGGYKISIRLKRKTNKNKRKSAAKKKLFSSFNKWEQPLFFSDIRKLGANQSKNSLTSEGIDFTTSMTKYNKKNISLKKSELLKIKQKKQSTLKKSISKRFFKLSKRGKYLIETLELLNFIGGM